MILIKSKTNNWIQSAFFIAIVILLAFLNLIVNKPFISWTNLALFTTILIIIFFSRRKIDSVAINSGNIEIKYHYWFIKNIFIKSAESVQLNVLDKTTFRGGTRISLQIIEKKKLIFEIDEIDGFNKEDILRLVTFHNEGV